MNWGVPYRCRKSQRTMRGFCALTALAGASLMAVPAQAGGVQASSNAQATVVAPLSLIKIQDLRFGRIVARTTAGTVTVNPDTGVCTVTGPILETGGCQFAQFAGMGTRRMTLRMQIPTTVTLTGPGGATMVADTFTLGLSPDLTYIGGNGHGLGNGNRRYTINPNSGIFTFRIGGRLNVGANQASGVYTGSFSVTVQYQ
jgi:spore coat protein U-like protein